jgi:hypothetical protein
MGGMPYRAVVIPAEQYEQERLYAQETLAATGPEPGDEVVLVAAVDPPVIFGLGRAVEGARVRYTHRILDDPLPAEGLEHGGPLDHETFEALVGKVGARHRVDADKRVWLVSLDLPIEAASPAEAVRHFWTYVRELGPAELPAFVSPAGDELAMQAFVLGEETNLDPEED